MPSRLGQPFFISTIWLPHGQLLTIIKERVSHSPDVNHCIYAINFWPKVDWKLLVLYTRLKTQWVWSQCLSLLSSPPQIAEDTLPRLVPSLPKIWKCPQYPKRVQSLGLCNTLLDAKLGLKSNHAVNVLGSTNS